MNRARRRWWWIFGASALAVGAALAWVTVLILQLEQSEEQRIREVAAREESLRLALWRMDSWLAPLLAVEAARPWRDYQPYFGPQQAYTKILGLIDPGEVLTPSPLLGYVSEYFPLHFQVDTAGWLSSPQTPEGNLLDLSLANGVELVRIEEKRALLETLRPELARLALESCQVAGAPPPEPAGADRAAESTALDQKEWVARKANLDAQVLGNEVLLKEAQGQEAEVEVVHPLLPVWLGAAQRLVFVRRVQISGGSLVQGILCDWPRLRAALLDQVQDLLPGAHLQPYPGGAAAAAAEPSPCLLAGLPAVLAAPAAPVSGGAHWSAAHGVVLLAWLVFLAAISATGFILHRSILFGEKRSRFAAAVTHELRTPLTTFRLYSEMLAEGMVEGEATRREYFQTLQAESERLSRLVENVLAYSRLEEGRSPRHLTRAGAGELLEKCAAALRDRAAAAGMSLEVEIDPSCRAALLEVDVEAVGQILFNLVDNACKYAGGAADQTIRLSAARSDGFVDVRVRDHGPGVSAAAERRVFAPFDRGDRKAGDTIPGVGLGLALSRGLAQDLGGRLILEPCSGPGAQFLLRLPV